MKKMNFAGGEPFLYPKYLGALCRYYKDDLKLESVSIVSNGTKVTEKWLSRYGAFVDILAISCDSVNPEINAAIGRADRGSGVPFDNVGKLFQIKEWCQQYGIRFKLNTVSILPKICCNLRSGDQGKAWRLPRVLFLDSIWMD